MVNIVLESFIKKRIALKYWLLGKEYFKAVEAMEFSSKFCIGFRKNGKTPEFEHQISIASFLRSLLIHLIYPEDTITTVFTHDLEEDYNVFSKELEQRFGVRVATANGYLTKRKKGVIKEKEFYFGEMSNCPIASIIKPSDRLHNIRTMLGVFTIEKQKEYIEETEQCILPMLKQAKKNFPRQEMAYENIKDVLLNQIDLIKAIHESKEGRDADT